MSSRSHSLLLVEDNPDDVFLMQRALKKAAIQLPMQIVGDGKEALEYLAGTGKYQDRTKYPLPSMVFLDLKLPYLNGFEVLDWVRQQPELRELNVFILSSSSEERDKKRAESLGAKAYLVKPPSSEMLAGVLASVDARNTFAATGG